MSYAHSTCRGGKMGQARRRGTFDQRKQSAIDRNIALRQAALELEAEIEAARTPEERERRRKGRQDLATLYALAHSFNAYGR